jgi:hypothetical protein
MIEALLLLVRGRTDGSDRILVMRRPKDTIKVPGVGRETGDLESHSNLYICPEENE